VTGIVGRPRRRYRVGDRVVVYEQHPDTTPPTMNMTGVLGTITGYYDFRGPVVSDPGRDGYMPPGPHYRVRVDESRGSLADTMVFGECELDRLPDHLQTGRARD
jgi:hypothetical protein